MARSMPAAERAMRHPCMDEGCAMRRPTAQRRAVPNCNDASVHDEQRLIRFTVPTTRVTCSAVRAEPARVEASMSTLISQARESRPRRAWADAAGSVAQKGKTSSSFEPASQSRPKRASLALSGNTKKWITFY